MPEGALLRVGFREAAREGNDGLDEPLCHEPTVPGLMAEFNI
jgi:hypothetical protein